MPILRRLAALALNLLLLQAILLGGGVACDAGMERSGTTAHGGASHAAASHDAPHVAARGGDDAHGAADAHASHGATACSVADGPTSCGMPHSSGHCASAASCGGLATLPARIAPRTAQAVRSDIAALSTLEPPSITTAPLLPPPRA